MLHPPTSPPEPAGATEGSSADWCAWLKEQEALIFREYEGRPGRLISDSNGEKDFVRDYAGREILELLQNSNDAAAKIGERGRVRIEIHPEGILAANTGAGFSRDGVTSLLLPHTSPKPSEGLQVVGHKGLGFRSVLNWTRTPLISSGNLSLAFSAEIALEKQNTLTHRNSTVRAAIEKQQKLVGERVVPLLAFPAFAEDGDLAQFLASEQRGLFSRLRELRAQGYDTVIAAPFSSPQIHATAEKQLKILQPEVLLFAGSLAELTVVVNGAVLFHWRLDVSKKGTARVFIGADNPERREWKLFRRGGKVPNEHVPADRPNGAKFEVVVALPKNGPPAGSLFCYFPTDVRFPYPVTCHATVDLISNRQQLQSTAANRFVLGQLAELMAEVARIVARARPPFAGLEMVAGESHAPDPLERFEFSKRLIAAARQKPIVPTLSGRLVRPDAARRFLFPETNWFPASAFPNMVRLGPEGEHADVIEKLEVPLFTDWQSALPHLEFATIEARAAFIGGMIRRGLGDQLASVPILIDHKGELVPVKYRVYLPISDQRNVEVPTWYEVRFLDGALAKALGQRLDRKEHDALANVLSVLGVARYSLDTLLGGMVAEANRRIQKDRSQESALRRELITALFALFPAHLPRDERAKFPRDVTVRLATKAGTFEEARAIYLSADYGIRGKLLETLYGTFAPESLLASPAEIGLACTVEAANDFLLWIGVEEYPRDIGLSTVDYLFRSHIEGHLTFPLMMGNDPFNSPKEWSAIWFSGLVTIDRLDEILTKSDPVAILSWLAMDSRAARWKTLSTDHGRIGNRAPYQKETRWYAGGIPSYIRWRISTTPWLPVRSGKKISPRDAVVETVRGLEQFFPIPVRPSKNRLEEFGVDPTLLRDAFDRAGVIPGFSEIDIARLYELLISLPERDPKGDLAKSVYRALLHHFEAADIENSSAALQFKARGRMWARSGGEEKYVPVSELWHVDSEDIPPALTRTLAVVALPRRSGTDKVETLFGLRCLTRDLIRRKVTAHKVTFVSAQFENDIETIKPLIMALRGSAKEPAEFRKVRILLCSEIGGEMEFENKVTELILEPWGWVMDDTTSTAYVQLDPSEDDPLASPLLADSVGQIFAAIFRIESTDEFARLFGCRAKDRLAILRRLAGDNEIPELADLEKAYRETITDRSEDEIQVPAGAFSPPILTPPAPPPPAPPESPPLLPSPPPNTPLVIETKRHTPRSSSSIELKITRRIRSGTREYSGRTQVTNSDLCEFKAREFESLSDPPRFPLRIGQVTGWKAAGVDLLSFESEEKRAAFLSGDHREDLVARFIEVKGRSSEGAKIDLRNNELTAAKKYRDRYFLYRLFDAGNGSFELAVLQNPLADETGVRHYCEINLDASTRTIPFTLRGGVTEQTLADALAAEARARNNPLFVSRNLPV